MFDVKDLKWWRGGASLRPVRVAMGRPALCDTFIQGQEMLDKNQKYSSEGYFLAQDATCESMYVAFQLTYFTYNKTQSCKKRRSEMSGRPVGYCAAWLLSYDQALTV